ncbi:TolC family protein, partial [Flavihumibacter sp. CACIAM 22H1]|uniref:TolC family protein n=1 Tax=Flavihumibacter sp. CACIAM 22H1 TaxID=1812911 RepID=UPI0007A7C919
PSIRAEWNLRDPENNKWWHVGRTGQQAVELEQLIRLGGKRKADLQLAKANTAVAQFNLESLLRNLLRQLWNKAVDQHVLQVRSYRYEQQLKPFAELVKQIELQVEKKNLPVRDLLRLQTTFLQMQQEQMNIGALLAQANADLRLLIGTEVPVSIQLDSISMLPASLPGIDSLLALARQNRPELKLSQAELQQAGALVKWEKSQAIPDLTGFANYDRQSGAFRNEFNMGIALPLPFFSRNQGGIKAAKFQQQAIAHKVDFLQQSVAEEVRVAYLQYMNRVKLWETGARSTDQLYTEVMKAAMDHYRKGNISLLEFMDLYESGLETFNSKLAMLEALLETVIQVNFAVATEVLPLKISSNL